MSDFNFTQSVANSSWVINHNLDVTSVVTDVSIDNGGSIEKVIPSSVVITDSNTITVNFGSVQSGFCRLITTGGLQPGIATFSIVINSATFDNVEYSVLPNTQPQGITFNDNGTKMFIVGNSTDTINQHNLSVAYDLSTASYSGISQALTGLNDPTQMVFNNDGSKMFIANTSASNYRIYEYALSTNYLITSLTQTTSINVQPQGFSINSIAFNLDGTKMFALDNSGGDSAVDLYNLSIGWDLTSAVYSGNSFSVQTQSAASSGLAFNPTGTEMYISDAGAAKGIFKYDLNTEFDILTAVYNSDFLSVPFPHDPTELTFNDDGTKMYLVSLQVDKVYQYSTNI